MEPDQDPFLSSPTQLDPLSSSYGESLATSTLVSKRKKKRGRWRKQRQRVKPLAYAHHAIGMPLSFYHHVGDKLLASTSHVIA